MSDTKFTPGPWRVGFHALHIDAVDPYGKGVMKVCDLRGWGHLTGMGHGACCMDADKAEEIQTANGNLIAAAPDLFMALSEIVAAHDDWEARKAQEEGAPIVNDSPLWSVAKTALAKARGESPAPQTPENSEVPA